MLERGDELERIEATLEAARAGSGRCLVIWGGAGLGKSSLVEAAGELASGMSMNVLRARGGELERDFTFGVATQLFERLVAGAEGADELRSGAAALSAPLFHGGAPPDGTAGEYALLHGLHWLAANFAESAPLLIAVDDAHWSDASTLRWLLYLQQRLDELPIALIAAARPREGGPQEELVERVARHGVAAEVALAPLSPGAVGELVRATLEEADEELVAACSTATGGNPFYVRDFLAAVRSGDGADGGRGSASGAILARVGSLPEPARRVAGAVAILGKEVPLDLAAALAGVDPDGAAAAADELAAASIIAPGAPLGFVHPLVREAVYEDIPTAQRARAHARAAELLRDLGADPEQIASQLVEAHGAAGDWAAPALRDAAARASARGAPAAAARYLRAAIEGALDVAERGPVLTELAIAEAKAQEGEPGARANDALDAIEDPRERARAALEIGMALVDAARQESAEVFAHGLEAIAQDDAGSDELAKTLAASRAAVQFSAGMSDPGDLEEIVARGEQGVATPAERLVLAHGALAPALRGESIDETRRLARAALAGPALDVTSPTAMAAFSLSVTSLFMTGLFAEAIEKLTVTLDRARDAGAVLAFGTLSHIRAHALHRSGRIEESIADAQSALDTVRYGWEPELPAIYAALALCLIERGELDAAEAALEIPGGAERWEATFTWADWLDARGRLRLAKGDARAALEDCLACGERLKPLGASHEAVVPWRTGAVAAALALGEAELASELAGEAVELARAFGAERELGASLAAAGNAAGGDRGIALLREAVEVLRSSEARLELARALADLGAALLAENHRLQAREALTEALDLAHRCRADALEATARELLVATGARPRRASARGSDALTPRERRIATMAAEGLGNREIAEALFITTKTVETHLGRAYRKLEISSRRDLPDALRDAEE